MPARPNTALAGPNAALAGPSAALAGPNAALAGPKTALAGPSPVLWWGSQWGLDQYWLKFALSAEIQFFGSLSFWLGLGRYGLRLSQQRKTNSKQSPFAVFALSSVWFGRYVRA